MHTSCLNFDPDYVPR